MRRSRTEELDCLTVSETLGLPFKEVRRAVDSFFGAIIRDAAILPFNDERRIYSHDLFGDYGRTWNIPSIGRMGPVYSRYLRWRSNEAGLLEQVDRRSFRKRMTQSEIEAIAADVLSGGTYSPAPKVKGSDIYKRIWMVGKDGKRMARQVIPKNKDNVQD